MEITIENSVEIELDSEIVLEHSFDRKKRVSKMAGKFNYRGRELIIKCLYFIETIKAPSKTTKYI